MKTLLNAPAGLPRRPASMTAFRWSRVLASATLAQGSFVSAHSDRQGPEGSRRHAGLRSQSLPREIARPAAPGSRSAEGIQPARRGGIPFGNAAPRSGNDSGGGQPGRILRCKGWETDPNAYIYFITQAQVWPTICDIIGKPEWKEHPDYANVATRLPRLNEIFGEIEKWTMTRTRFEAWRSLTNTTSPAGRFSQ